MFCPVFSRDVTVFTLFTVETGLDHGSLYKLCPCCTPACPSGMVRYTPQFITICGYWPYVVSKSEVIFLPRTFPCFRLSRPTESTYQIPKYKRLPIKFHIPLNFLNSAEGRYSCQEQQEQYQQTKKTHHGVVYTSDVKN